MRADTAAQRVPPALPVLSPAALPRRWRLARQAARGLVVAGVLLPLGAALGLALQEAASVAAWQALRDDVQTGPALRLSLVSALGSTALSTALALGLLTALWDRPAGARWLARLPAMLAVPHAAFAIGLALLLAPSGWIARLLAPLAGWEAPPDWRSVNDPAAWSLTLALALKELPFLAWTLAAWLARPEVGPRLRAQIALGRSLGLSASQVWWRALWPAWSRAMLWPVGAVLAYGLTGVDMALILGPGSPPTLAVLAWQALMDADPARNAQGAAAAVLLAGVLGAVVAGAGLVRRLTRPMRRRWQIRGIGMPSPSPVPNRPRVTGVTVAGVLAGALSALWLAAGAALALASVSGVWRFPALWPSGWTLQPWHQVAEALPTLGLTLAVGLGAALLAVLLVLLWLAATPPHWDRPAAGVLALPVLVPPLLLSAGLYRLALALRMDGQALALVAAHALMALPYVAVGLMPAWRQADPRPAQLALALGLSRAAVAWRVRRPMLARPLAAALAVGFAVSVAQYLPTLFLGAGRLTTVGTEAVTLAAGGQRATAAAFAALQALLPLLAFALAARVGRGDGGGAGRA